jgi:hypothetical protein
MYTTRSELFQVAGSLAALPGLERSSRFRCYPDVRTNRPVLETLVISSAPLLRMACPRRMMRSPGIVVPEFVTVALLL